MCMHRRRELQLNMQLPCKYTANNLNPNQHRIVRESGSRLVIESGVWGTSTIRAVALSRIAVEYNSIRWRIAVDSSMSECRDPATSAFMALVFLASPPPFSSKAPCARR